MKAIFCAAVVLLFLSACSSSELTPEAQLSAKALAEESAKVEKNPSRETALRSAGFKSVAAGNAGAYMNRQSSALRAALRGAKGIAFSRRGFDIILTMQSAHLFNGGDIAVKPGFRPVLKRIANVLIEYDRTKVTLTGYTDSNGWDKFNQSLSEFRADSIAQDLRTSGVPPIRIAVEGAGEASPIASNASFSGRATNNRIVLTISAL